MRSIQFLSYHNWYNGRLYGNVSKFENCTFEINDPSIVQSNMVTAWDVEGVQFISNTFINNVPNSGSNPPPPSETPKFIGIYSEDAGYYVHFKNSFENLEYGIYTADVALLKTIIIDNNHFSECHGAIYSQSHLSLAVTRNQIDVGVEKWGYKPFGIYLNDCDVVFVEDNIIEQPSSPNDERQGIVLANMYSATNIYNNSFEVYYSAINYQYNKGVTYECNDMQYSGTGIILYRQGIRGYQGSCFIGTNQKDAANKFPGNWDLKFMPGGTPPIIIYYHRTNNLPYKPSDVSSTIVPVQCSTEIANSCYSNFSGTGYGGYSSELETELDEIRSLRDDEGNDPETTEFYEYEYDRIFNKIIFSYMDQLDSIEGSMVVSSDLDGLINFLEEERNTESKTNLILVAAYLSNENINEAFDEMNTYESQVDTLDNREQIFSLIVETIVDGYKLNEIDSTKESFLRSLEDSYSDRSFGMARSLLSMNWGDFYHPYQEEDYPARMAAPASEEIPETNQPSNNYLASSLVVVPNPFNNEVSIETDVQECGGQTTLQIRSITGQLMLSKKLTSGKNTVRIYTDNMESGAYICYILCDNEIINNVKVFKY